MNRLNSNKSILKLYNSLEFQGYSFGNTEACSGEVVFSTAAFGFPETLTDPCCEGKIICLTYPLAGNYGAPAEQIISSIVRNYESSQAHVAGLIVADYSFEYSHWNAVCSLDQWMKDHKIPGIYGVDTRAITKYIRDNGSCLGQIVPQGYNPIENLYDPNTIDLVSKVSCKEIINYHPTGKAAKKVVVVDCGVRNSTLGTLVDINIAVTRVPHDFDFNTLECDAVVLSSGPDSKIFCQKTINNIKVALAADKPVLGLGVGALYLAIASGASIYKLPFGHHSDNQPVRVDGTNKCYITSQFHNYTADDKSLPQGWNKLCSNLNDGSLEAFRKEDAPVMGCLFENDFVYDLFFNAL